jgi:TetR/AcrR family transcriptional regulator
LIKNFLWSLDDLGAFEQPSGRASLKKSTAPENATRTTPGKTRIQAKNEARILDAAQEVFAEFGFSGATVDRIAAKAGMSKPNLHYYFKRKRDLYLAVLQRTLEVWLAPLEELDVDSDPQQELRRYITRKLELSRLNPVASRVFANEILQGAPVLHDYLGSDLRQLVQRKAKVIRTWSETGRLAAVDPYHLIFLIWAATQHYADFAPQVTAVMGIDRLSERDFAEIDDTLSRIILRGLLPDDRR